MKTIIAIFYGLCACALVSIVFRVIGVWVVDVLLKSTGGLVNAETIITWKYVTPVIFGALAFYFVYTITKERE